MIESPGFQHALGAVLRHEGGYTEDHAGATNYGVSLRYLKTLKIDADGDGYQDGDLDRDGDIDADDIRGMSMADAARIYYTQWWARYEYGLLWNSGVATKVLDLSVNIGPKQCHRVLQRAIWGCGIQVEVDGALGPKTLAAANRLPGLMLMVAIRTDAAAFYRGLADKNPDRFLKYLRGWLNRALDPKDFDEGRAG